MNPEEPLTVVLSSTEPQQQVPDQSDVPQRKRTVSKAKGSYRQHALQQRNELNSLVKRTDKLLIAELREIEIQELQKKVQRGRQDGRLRTAHKQARVHTPSAFSRPSSAMAVPRTPPTRLFDMGFSFDSSTEDSAIVLEQSTSKLHLHIHISHEEVPNAIHHQIAGPPPPLKLGYPPRPNRPRSPDDKRTKEEIIRNILPNIAKSRPKSASAIVAKTVGLQLSQIEDSNSVTTSEALEYEILMKENKAYKWDLKELPVEVYPAAVASPPKARKYLKVSDLKPRPKSAVDYRQLQAAPTPEKHAGKQNPFDTLSPRSASTRGDAYNPEHTASRDQDGLAYFPRRSLNSSRESSLVMIPTSSFRINNGTYDTKMSRDLYHHTLNQSSVDSNLILFSPQRVSNHHQDRDSLWN